MFDNKIYYIQIYKFQLMQYEAFVEYYGRLKDNGKGREAYKIYEKINEKEEYLNDLVKYIREMDSN